MKRKREEDPLSQDEPPEKKRKIDDDDGIDELLTCSVSLEKMVWPVTLFCGHTLELKSVRNLEKCPICRECVIALPKVNFNMIGITEKKFPGYREKNMYEDPLAIQQEPYGQIALRKINLGLTSKLELYFEQMKVDFLEAAIDNCIKSGSTSKIRVAELARTDGHWDDLCKYALKQKLELKYNNYYGQPKSIDFKFIK